MLDVMDEYNQYSSNDIREIFQVALIDDSLNVDFGWGRCAGSEGSILDK